MNLKNKKVIIAGIVAGVVIVTFGALACAGVFRGFDAQRYVKAVLDQTLKGEVKAAVSVMDGVTEKELETQYEAGITSFVESSFLNGIEASEKVQKTYQDHCKKIFAGMKYEVGEAEKTGEDSFCVPVTYQPSDVYTKFKASVAQEGQKLTAKMENSEYEGETIEEIQTQMYAELLSNSCTLLEEAYNTMEFWKKETMEFTVKKGANGLYKVDETQIAEFITKIMGLDAIQD